MIARRLEEVVGREKELWHQCPVIENLFFCLLAIVLWDEVQPYQGRMGSLFSILLHLPKSEQGANTLLLRWLASYLLVFYFPNLSFVWSVLFEIWKRFYERLLASCHFALEFFWWIWTSCECFFFPQRCFLV